MNFWKKATAFIMALGMTLGFAACGGDVENESSGNSGSSVGEQPVAEQLNADEMAAAIQAVYNSENFTITYEETGVEGQNEFTASRTIACADGKCYQVYSKTSKNSAMQTEYSYTGKVEGEYYYWTSEDQEIWDCEAMTDLEEGEDPTSAKYFLERIFSYCKYDYFEYVNDMHSFSILLGPTVEVKVVGGKIVEFRYEDETSLTGTIAYGNASVGELPEIDG